MTEWILAGGFVLAAAAAIAWLPPCHPAQLWLVPWAAVLVLLAWRLIPYRELSTVTAALIAGGSAAFVAGTMLGDRLTRGRLTRLPWRDAEAPSLAVALAAAATLIGLVAFLGQLTARFGVRAALISDANVRLEIGSGATAVTIKYIYFAFATAMLASICVARADTPRARAGWATVAAGAVASQYFSTGRSNVLLAAIMALVAFALARPRPPRRRTVLASGAFLVVATIPLFLAVGSLLGKSLENSDLRTFENAFTRHEWAQPLALAYQYATAPVPALNEVVAVTPASGRADGCATLRVACSALSRISDVTPDPQLAGFTGAPIGWNTFTALYAPLVDVGPYLAPVVLLALGLFTGLLWAWASTRTAQGIALYAGFSAAVAYSTVENNLLAPHLIGAGLLGVLALWASGRLTRLARRVRSSRPSSGGPP